MTLEQGKNVEINKNTFCVAPFTHQSTKTDGSIKAWLQSTALKLVI